MTIVDKIWNEKLQYDIERKAAKMSTLLSGKIDKYEYLTGKEILPSGQRRVIEKTRLIIILEVKLWENKLKQLKIKEQNKFRF